MQVRVGDTRRRGAQEDRRQKDDYQEDYRHQKGDRINIRNQNIFTFTQAVQTSVLVNRHIYCIIWGEGVERFVDQMKPPKMVTNINTSNPKGYFFFCVSGGLSGKRRTFWLSESTFTSNFCNNCNIC